MALNVEDIPSIAQSLYDSKNILVTPLWKYEIETTTNDHFPVFLKLENFQKTGSFKIRGVTNWFNKKKEKNNGQGMKLVTMSAGNYGKSFATMVEKENVKGIICMPKTAPADRQQTLERYRGIQVEITDSDKLMDHVEYYVSQGWEFAHPFNDIDLIKGYGSISIEILDQLKQLNESSLTEEDFVVVPCGGGGLISGIALGLHAMNCKAKIIGVEPVGAPCQFKSRQLGEASSIDVEPTIAAGLAPPFAGKICFEIIQKYVKDLVLVSDDDIVYAMRILFDQGLVVEPSGAAAFAALIFKKIEVKENSKVVCVVSGSNITARELNHLLSNPDN